MKTIFINGSPKKRLAASAYFLGVQRFFTGGKSEKYKLRTKADGKAILPHIESGDALVFVLPLFVDGVPSHVLAFLKELETYLKSNQIEVTVYVFANNGYIEGKQNEPLMQIFENFCARSHAKWGGGIGVGGGVMLNVYRIVFVVQIALLFVSMLFGAVSGEERVMTDALLNFLQQAAVLAFLNAGVFFYSFLMGLHIRKRSSFGHRYTRIMVPSFLFILFADVFFLIISVFKGGFFRGWLKRKALPQ